ncbi:lytic transglycosylase domain-containing protein [bacterium]|jgi:soluble lytic murein transglycosylase-like protein|nr:lytic transglycosylase domain-containing protein [bacterium]MBT3581751.1 lytic transglycosylase domain-containing protein [bacterium]MBT4552873.1 lytic transglycosylase domain-containing protein [bacterium]MBT7088732.1 lytic transglycosylase domain-containing protein [bacterium]
MQVIPIVAILFIVFFSSPQKEAPTDSLKKSFKQEETKTAVPRNPWRTPAPSKTKIKPTPSRLNIAQGSVEEVTYDQRDTDYKSILKYITSKYKKIQIKDAKEIAKSLVDYGREHDLDPKFAAAVIARESAFNRKSVSSTGAKGLGQIKDFNHKLLGIKDPFSIKQNVSGTVQYLKSLLGKWTDSSKKVSLSLASYYKGYGAVTRANSELDNTTQKYVDDILNKYKEIKGFRENIERENVNIAR